MTTETSNPKAYIQENRETLVRILKHGNDDFVRALVLAALIEFDDDPNLDVVKAELERAQELEGSR